MEESEEGDQMSIAREESGFQENEEGTQMSIAREESGSQENEGSSLMSVVPEEPGSQENEVSLLLCCCSSCHRAYHNFILRTTLPNCISETSYKNKK